MKQLSNEQICEQVYLRAEIDPAWKMKDGNVIVEEESKIHTFMRCKFCGLGAWYSIDRYGYHDAATYARIKAKKCWKCLQ